MTSIDKTTDGYLPSTIENIDLALYNWLNDELNLYSETNQGWSKVPVIWVSGERSWQIKNEKSLRDSNDNFILPVISLERKEITKDKTDKGIYWGDVRPSKDEKGGSIAIHTRINQNKTSNFANSHSKKTTGQPNFKKENKKIVYETKFIPMPVYAAINYEIDLKTEYQQQMNELLQPFITFTGAVNYFIIENNGHRYECFVDQSYSNSNNVSDLQKNERLFNSKINIKVLGHFTGKSQNDERPSVIKRENIVEVKIPREYVIFDEESDKKRIW